MSRSFLLALLVAVPAFFAGRSGAAQDAPTPDVAPPPPDAPTLAPPPAPDSAQGSLSASSMPPGNLYLDGTDTGLTTPVVDLPVAPGKHTLKIVSPDGREQSTDFDIESGGSLNLNVNLPEPLPAEVGEAATPAVATPEPSVVLAPTPWTWMTVAGWSGFGLGTMGLLAGAVVLTTPTDPDQQLGFGLFGLGVGFVVGGGVLLYLDDELAHSTGPGGGPAV